MSKKKPAAQMARQPSQTTDQPKTEQPPVDQPKMEQPPVDQPKTERPPEEQPPVDQLKTEQPEVEQVLTQEVLEIDPIEKARKANLVAAIEARRKAACGEK